jgi:hypothetical protein
LTYLRYRDQEALPSHAFPVWPFATNRGVAKGRAG